MTTGSLGSQWHTHERKNIKYKFAEFTKEQKINKSKIKTVNEKHFTVY